MRRDYKLLAVASAVLVVLALVVSVVTVGVEGSAAVFALSAIVLAVLSGQE